VDVVGGVREGDEVVVGGRCGGVREGDEMVVGGLRMLYFGERGVERAMEWQFSEAVFQ